MWFFNNYILDREFTLRPFHDVCKVHDYNYGIGGNAFDRLYYDLKLKAMIAQFGSAIKAYLTFIGIRDRGCTFFNYRSEPKGVPIGPVCSDALGF